MGFCWPLTIGSLMTVDLEAARKLDAKVAESLGCQPWRSEATHGEDYCGCGGSIHGNRKRRHYVSDYWPLLPYTTAPTPDTMMQLIEHAETDGWNLKIVHHAEDYSRFAQFWKYPYKVDWSVADTLPAAVTKAYCKAYGLLGDAE